MIHPSTYVAARLKPEALRCLAVCEGGNCRSVSLALLLKASSIGPDGLPTDGPHFDALACSWKDTTPHTLNMLCEWAEAIFAMESYMAAKIPAQFADKVNVVDVGVDVWMNPFSVTLVEKIRGIIGGMTFKAVTRASA